jgi:hypothetical protein
MTRHAWTTDDQKAWLEQKRAAFIEAKQKGTAAMKEFYLGAFIEFREKWPMVPATQEEITAAGSVELATKIKREKYDKVCRTLSIMKRRLTYLCSV